MPTALIAFNVSLWYGCLPGHAVSCSDAAQVYLQSELKRETFVILPKELWLPGWTEGLGERVMLAVRLRKFLYSHPKDSRLWQQHLAKVLVVKGLRIPVIVRLRLRYPPFS